MFSIPHKSLPEAIKYEIMWIMNQFDQASFQSKVLTVIGLSVLSLGALYAIYLARQPLLWIAIAGFLAVAINPVVHRLQKLMPKQSLGLATLLVLGGLSGAAGLLVWLFMAPFVQQLLAMIAVLPDLVTKINNLITELPIQISQQQLLNSATQFGSVILSVITNLIGALVAVVAILSLMFFMTLEASSMRTFAQHLTTSKQTERLNHFGREVYGIINGYVIGNFIISGIYGVVSALILWLVGSPYFLLLALIVALIDLIPLVGATIGAALVALIFLVGGQPLAAAAFIVYTILYVQFESAVLNPAIYSKNVDVSPLLVLVSILIGGALAGILGALVAIPVAATLKVVVTTWLEDRSTSTKS